MVFHLAKSMDTTSGGTGPPKKSHDFEDYDNVDEDVFDEPIATKLTQGVQNAFKDLSSLTRKYQPKGYSLIVYNIEKELRNEDIILNHLKEIKSDAEKAVNYILFTQAGHLMVNIKSVKFFNELLSLEKFIDNKKFKAIDDPYEQRTIVIKGKTYEEMKNKHLESLTAQGITAIEEIKSMRKEVEIYVVKALCVNEKTAQDFIETGFIQIGLRRLKVKKYERPTKTVVCFKCAKFNHIASNCKSKIIKCFKCAGEHEATDCPLKTIESVEPDKYNCPNCNEHHPATYAGCKKFKENLTKLKAKKQKQKRQEDKEEEKDETYRNESDNPVPISLEQQKKRNTSTKPTAAKKSTTKSTTDNSRKSTNTQQEQQKNENHLKRIIEDNNTYLRNATRALDEHRTTLKEIQKNMTTLNMNVASNTGKINSLEKKMSELESHLNSNHNNLLNVRSTLIALTRVFLNYKSTIIQDEITAESLSNQILNVICGNLNVPPSDIIATGFMLTHNPNHESAHQ